MDSSGSQAAEARLAREMRVGAASGAEFPLERILDGISEAISLLDREWRYTYVNAHAEMLAGMKREEMVGRCIWDLFPAGLGSAFEIGARRAIEEQQQTTVEHYFPTFN